MATLSTAFLTNDIDSLTEVIDIEDLYRYPRLPWSQESLTYNAKITPRLVDDVSKGIINTVGQWDLTTLFWVVGHRHKIVIPSKLKIDRESVSIYHDQISLDIINYFQSHYDDVLIGEWLWKDLIQTLPFDDILTLYCCDAITTPALFGRLVLRHELTLDQVDRVIDLVGFDGWDWSKVTQLVSSDDIINNPDRPWDASSIFRNRDLTPALVQQWRSRLPAHIDEFNVGQCLASLLSLDHLLGLHDFSRRIWKTEWFYPNKKIPIAAIVDDLQHRRNVYGVVNYDRLCERATLEEFLLYVYHELNDTTRSSRSMVAFDRADIRQVYHAINQTYRRRRPYVPTVADLCRVREVRVTDFYVLCRIEEPHGDPGFIPIQAKYHDLVVYGSI